MSIPLVFCSAFVLTLVPLAAAQDYQAFGKGCSGSAAASCPSNNSNASQLHKKIVSINPQLAIEVRAFTPVISGFEIFTKADSKRSINAWILLPDASGNPDETKPFATGTLTVDTTPGWYRVTFPQQVILGANTRYFLSWDPGKGSTPLIDDPRAMTGTTSVHYHRTFFFPNWQWFGPFNTERWAWRVVCPGGSRAIPTMAANGFPILGNSNYALDLLGARAGVVALGVLGASNTSWNTIPLPIDMAGAGALGCSLLVSVDVILGFKTDANGRASLKLPIPNDSRLKGLKFHGQWLVLDAKANSLGIAFSNGGTSIIG